MKNLIIFLLLFISISLFADGLQPVGDGSVGDPYQVATLDNLLWVSTNDVSWSSYFIQTADIDASTTSSWNGGQGFIPIGNSPTYFTGTYNGQGYTIDGLYINRNVFQGLFGYCDNSTIENLGVINVDVTGSMLIGGLVGGSYNSSTISNCYSTGSVSGTINTTGGLVGSTASSTISNCYSSCNVSGNIPLLTGNFNGGLVGSTSSSTISNCCSTGSVVGSTAIGGLVGKNNDDSTISNCYSTGSVWGYDELAGGLVGGNYNSSTIINCYSTGGVEGDISTGGLVGNNDSSTISNSFWNTQTSGQTTSDGGTGKTTAEMKNVRTFTDVAWSTGLSSPWDFVGNPYDDIANDDYWDIDVSINNGYPYLSGLFVPGIPQNVIISTSLTEINITWDLVAGASSYKVYSSDDPYGTFTEDLSGIFSSESWTAPASNGKKFYYIKAVN